MKVLEDGGTKKSACEILNISYNTKRLQNIIDEHAQNLERRRIKREANKGTNLRSDEYEDIILWTLKGRSITKLAEYLCRPLSLIKETKETLGIPIIPKKSDPGITIVPDQCVVDSFEIGELVWSCKYHALAYIRRPVDTRGYWIYVMEEMKEQAKWFPGVEIGGFFAAQPTYDLASLKHLTKYINFEKKLIY